MTNVTLRNDFHNTSCTIRTELNYVHYISSTIYPTSRQIKAAKRKLCGIKGCTCGGIRGPQEHNGKRLIVTEMPDIVAKAVCDWGAGRV